MAAAVVLGCALAGPARAETFNVDDNSQDQGDQIPGDGFCDGDTTGCTLRAAVDEANADPGLDQINVPAGTYELTIGPLQPEEDMTITGASARSTVVRADTDLSGDGLFRVFEVVSTGANVLLSRMRVERGRATDLAGFFGGNIRNDGILTLRDTTVADGRAFSGGGVSNVGGTLTVENSTFTGNRAIDGGGDSGAIHNFGIGGGDPQAATLIVRNSTISGNSARLGGGIFSWADPGGGGNRVTVVNSTIAFNRSDEEPPRGEGAAIIANNGTVATVTNTIVGPNTSASGGPNCTVSVDSRLVSGGYNIETGTDCGFTATGDRRNTSPQLGALANNGGGTDTHALAFTSPARNAGAACLPTDQRGVGRPQGPACDIGAFEVVESLVVLDTDGDGLPNSGDTCPFDRGPAPSGCPAPVLGRFFNAFPVRGDVYVSLPPVRAAQARTVPGIKGRTFVPLQVARQVPVGSILDTRRGAVRVLSARNTSGTTQSGTFAAGVFQVLQSRSRRARGLTELRLKGSSFRNCRVRARRSTDEVTAARLSRRAKRRLRANARGRFRTRGRYSAATVRGTIWTTTDRCDGTLVKVRRGRVVVRNLRKKRNRLVRAGKSLFVRAPG